MDIPYSCIRAPSTCDALALLDGGRTNRKGGLILSIRNVKEADLDALKRAAGQQELEQNFDAALEVWNRVNFASRLTPSVPSSNQAIQRDHRVGFVPWERVLDGAS
jgi:hypothetical protein